MDYSLVTGEKHAIEQAPDGSPVITVTSQEEYAAAMDSLQSTGGTVLVDTSGGAFRLDTHNVNAESRILVTSADPDVPAEILGMKVSRTSNITFTGLDFPPVEERDGPVQAAYFQNSINIQFADNTIRGDADGKLGIDTMEEAFGGGVFMRGCTDMVITNNVIDSVKTGIGTSNGTNTLLQGNILTGMQGDVFRVVSSVDTTVDSNVVDGLNGSSGDFNHPDMLQYYDNDPDEPVIRLTITNNYFNSGDTSYQGIYGGMNHDSGPYEDIRIENNMIITGSSNGVKIGWFEGVVIKDNTVLYNADAVSHKTMDEEFPDSSPPLISVYAGADVEVTGNIGNVMIRDEEKDGLTGSVVFENNFEVDYVNADAENHIDQIMVNVGMGGDKDIRDFQLLENSIAEGFGSSLSAQGDLGLLSLRAVTTANMPQCMTFMVHDAADGAVYTWTTADGRVFQGAQVDIAFTDLGNQEVTLEAVTADGESTSITRRVLIEDASLFEFDAETGFPAKGDNKAEDVYVLNGDAQIEASDDGSGRMVLDLDPDDSFSIARGMDQFVDLSKFSIMLEFRQQAPDVGGYIQSAGNILTKRGGFVLDVDAEGTLTLVAWDSDGVRHEVSTDPGVLLDTDWHCLTLSYDGAAGDESGLSLRLDDAEVARVEMSGSFDLSDRPIQVGALGNNPGIDAEVAGLRVVDIVTSCDAEVMDPLSLLSEAALTGIVIEEVSAPASEIAGIPLDDASGLEGTLVDQVDFDALDSEDGAAEGVTLVQGRNGLAIDFDGSEGQSFALGDLSDLEGAESFTVATSLRIDDMNDTGRILFLRGLLDMSVGKNGTLDLRTTLTNDAGERVTDRGLISGDAAADLGDGAFHRVVASYSGTDGVMSVWIDGELTYESALEGHVGEIAQTMIGNSWGDTFDGAVEGVSIFAEAVDAETVTLDHAAFSGIAELVSESAAPQYASLSDSELGESLIASEDFEGLIDPEADLVAADLIETETGQAIDFDGGEGQSFRLEGIDALEGAQSFTVATTLQVDDMSNAGQILKIRGLFDMAVNEDGTLDWSTTLKNEDGQSVKVRSLIAGDHAANLGDGQQHRVVASYDQDASEIQLWIDGDLADSASIDGEVGEIRQALLGNAWGDVFDGAIEDIAIFDQAADADLIESDYLQFDNTEVG
ncbi:LamG-like jellyroll fold domain-containing protein [Meridianimarinicoccus aquatilis]|uniref:PKD domain-containing protein n=1 Tax=Meridianimarinicoccus aquatilis TaxID=2552766 RepID=A0A4R6APP6_9RHOB|nr:LamG-like jellyroll fold domain-containing protein [Fluviibacterium aquatile]TDL86401.1 hypothetical protein E2L05_13300 [Fluviibacterium aquatile]